jgi:hypothetical protein
MKTYLVINAQVKCQDSMELQTFGIKTILETINIHDAIGLELEGTVNIFLNLKCNQLNERQIS